MLKKILIIVVPIVLLACNSTRNAREIEQNFFIGQE